MLGYNATLTTTDSAAPRQPKRHYEPRANSCAKINPRVMQSIHELSQVRQECSMQDRWDRHAEQVGHARKHAEQVGQAFMQDR